MYRNTLNNIVCVPLISLPLISALLATSSSTHAAGPLVLSGPAGNTPVTYQNPVITLHAESGSLGSKTNAQADTLVQDAISLWNNVTTSDINLILDDSQIITDINSSNFENFLPSLDGSVFNASDGLNPVVYDDDGAIIDAYFGAGQSDFTIGIAASIYTLGGSSFLEGYAVINGKSLRSDDILKLLIAHEIGHFFGLDHSQADIDYTESSTSSPFFCSDMTNSKYPAMYPFACRDTFNLHPDDISSVSTLYPNTQTSTNYGTLNGRLIDQSGNPILGANIWAKNTVTDEVYSVVSDYLRQGNGFYQLMLPAGNYTLHVNSINTAFTAGSGVGPYSSSSGDASFDCPHPLTETTYQGATPGTPEIITISNGLPATSIDFSLADVNVGLCAPISNDSDSKGQLSLWGLLSMTGLLTGIRRFLQNTSC